MGLKDFLKEKCNEYFINNNKDIFQVEHVTLAKYPGKGVGYRVMSLQKKFLLPFNWKSHQNCVGI